MSTYRNVMLLIADDWSRLAGCYPDFPGSCVVRTPRIDAFAEEGTVFDNGFCVSPSCAVSRACLLTGYYPQTHGQYGHCHGTHGFRTHERMSSLSKDLRAAGFATALIGKKHVAPESVYPFEYERSPLSNVNDLAAAAREFLSQNGERPFYLHVGFNEPHRIGYSYGNLFGSSYIERGVPVQEYSPDEVEVPLFLPDLPEVRRDLAEYYRAVSRFDHGIGLLLDVLEQSGRAHDTVVVVTTDHAMPFPGAKASAYDTGHHCPFILRAPDIRGGERNDAVFNWCDIRPTLHEWSGVTPSVELPGRSLLPVLGQTHPDGWDETFFSHCFHGITEYNPYRVLHGRRYKYIRYLTDGSASTLPSDLYRSPTWQAVLHSPSPSYGMRLKQQMLQHAPEEFFDIEADPGETTNLINQPKLQSEIERMRRCVIEWRMQTKDPWLEIDFQQGRLDFDPINLR